jgi:hypothetical protein
LTISVLPNGIPMAPSVSCSAREIQYSERLIHFGGTPASQDDLTKNWSRKLEHR